MPLYNIHIEATDPLLFGSIKPEDRGLYFKADTECSRSVTCVILSVVLVFLERSVLVQETRGILLLLLLAFAQRSASDWI